MRTNFPNPDDILNFSLIIEPDEGMYKNGVFTFDFKINQNFPHDPPKVKCTQKIYHPNIDLEGNVCLNILREDWKPVLNLNAVIVGLQVHCFQFWKGMARGYLFLVKGHNYMMEDFDIGARRTMLKSSFNSSSSWSPTRQIP